MIFKAGGSCDNPVSRKIEMSERQSVRKPTAAAKFEAEDASACLSWMEQVLGPLGVSCTVKSEGQFLPTISML